MTVMLSKKKVKATRKVGLRKLYEDRDGNIVLVISGCDGYQQWQALQTRESLWRFKDCGSFEHIMTKWRAYKQASEWIDRKGSSDDHCGHVYALQGDETNTENERFTCIAEYDCASGEMSVYQDRMGAEAMALYYL